MPPAAQANLYTTAQDVEDLLSALGVRGRVDDDSSGETETDESGFVAKAINYATARVKFYCLGRYKDADLASAWLVNDWATTIAAFWLSARRGNPVPEQLRELYEGSDGKGGVLGDMAEVKAGRAQIPDIGTRHVDWPAWSNIYVDPRYRVRQARVQRQISERTPPEGRAQAVDWASEQTPEI